MNYPKRCPVFRKAGPTERGSYPGLIPATSPKDKIASRELRNFVKKASLGDQNVVPRLALSPLPSPPPPPPSSNCSFLLLCKVGRGILSQGLNSALGPISCCRLLSSQQAPRVPQSMLVEKLAENAVVTKIWIIQKRIIQKEFRQL